MIKLVDEGQPRKTKLHVLIKLFNHQITYEIHNNNFVFDRYLHVTGDQSCAKKFSEKEK